MPKGIRHQRRQLSPDSGWLSGQRPRWTWVVVLALVVSALALAFIPRREFDGVQGTLVSGLVTGATLVSALVAWLSYGRKVDISKQDLHDQADRLATAVRKQWDEEIGRREFNAKCPLPVRWVAADATLFDDWGTLQELATVGIGWRGDRPSAWARGPAELAGAGNALKDVFKRVPTGRLVVLGEPGSGKTTLMVRFVLDMLAVREDGGTVPVLVSLASWSPQADDLNSWLAAQLSSDLGLADMGVSNLRGAALVRALLDERLLVPILDGLDEIPPAARAIAVTQINNALQPGESCVVTCRTDEFREALRPPGGPEVTLRAAGGIQLCPLESRSDTEKVAEYLLTDAGGPEARNRWAKAIDRLNPATPVGQALTTPLMVMLACTAYNPRPGGGTAEPRDPAELCAPGLASRTDVELYLLDAFIPAAFSVNLEVAGRWNTAKACDWLLFLASHLETTLDTTELAWWQFNRAVRPVVLGLLAGLVAGLGAAMAAGLGTASARSTDWADRWARGWPDLRPGNRNRDYCHGREVAPRAFSGNGSPASPWSCPRDCGRARRRTRDRNHLRALLRRSPWPRSWCLSPAWSLRSSTGSRTRSRSRSWRRDTMSRRPRGYCAGVSASPPSRPRSRLALRRAS